MSNCPQIRTAVCTALLAIGVVLSGMIAGEAQNTPSPSATAIVRRCAQNMLKQIRSPTPIRFQERTEAPWGSEVRDVIITKEGRVDRLIAVGDRSLTVAQQKKEVDRLKLLLQRSASQAVAPAQDGETQRRLKLVAAIPAAFSYQRSGREESSAQEFKFWPAERFNPENHETRVYKGMRGIMRIDPRHDQLLHVDGEIFRNVSFGWGILGRLHKGGKFIIEQREVLPNHWEITEMDFDFTCAVFLFSERHYIRKITNTAYTWIDPDTRLEAAIGLLLSQPAEPPVPSTGAN
ncbi:MAG: hypothetical protein ACYCOX_04800 [Acidobacteriaceae bacterium]